MPTEHKEPRRLPEKAWALPFNVLTPHWGTRPVRVESQMGRQDWKGLPRAHQRSLPRYKEETKAQRGQEYKAQSQSRWRRMHLCLEKKLGKPSKLWRKERHTVGWGRGGISVEL